MDKFREIVKEGSVYAIQGFQVKPARPTYRAVHNKHRITIAAFTKVEPVVPELSSIPSLGYSLQPLSFLQKRFDTKNIVLSDITGVITEFTGLIYSTAEGQPRRNMKIKDIDENQFGITLWGNDAENFDEESIRASSNNGNICMLFLSMATSMYREQLCFKFTSLTRYYINADIPETASLKRKYGDEPDQINWQQVQNVRVEAPETTLCSLAKQDKDDIVGKYFKIPIEITSVSAKTWWYWACKVCVKSTKPTGSIFTCSGAQCRCIEGDKRFVINASATDIIRSANDEEATGSFAFFGTQGRILTGCEEDVVFASTEGKTEELPPAIAATIGRKYLVTGRVTQDIYEQEPIPFRVSATELIDSSPVVSRRAAAANLTTSSQQDASSPPNQSESGQALDATPSKEVTGNYESDIEEDSSSASGRRSKRAKTPASTAGKKQINRNLFPKK